MTDATKTKPADEDKKAKAPAAKPDASKPSGKKERVSITLTRTNILAAKIDSLAANADASHDLVDDLLVGREESKHPALPHLRTAFDKLHEARTLIEDANKAIAEAKVAVEDVL